MSARLYLVTPPSLDLGEAADRLRALLAAAPVACVRLSLGAVADQAAWTDAANTLLPVCHEADVALVLTDHYRLVPSLGLDGVHLSASRTPVREVREILGRDAIVGTFAGTSRHQGMVLAEAGADYVAFGPVRTESGLGDGEGATDDLFQWWSEMIEIPCVAEGGVTVEDAERLAPLADFVVPDFAVWEADGPELLARYGDVLPSFARD